MTRMAIWSRTLTRASESPFLEKTTKELKELYEYLKKEQPNEYLQH